MKLSTDALLDEYMELLPQDSLQSIRTLQFIAQLAPILGSKTDKSLHKDGILFNKAWYGMNLQMRIGINRTIIHKSMNKAVREKNEAFAIRTASFARGTYDRNSIAGAKAFEKICSIIMKEPVILQSICKMQ